MGIKGVVLCGGLSSRMGTDKGTHVYNGSTFLEITHNILSSACESVVVSVNESQLEAYQKDFPNYSFVVDDGPWKGPLKGMLSVHQSSSEDDLLVVPCDMLKINEDLLKGLVNNESNVYKTDEIQPFPGLYTASKLHEILKAEPKKFSLRYIIEEFKIKQIKHEDSSVFYNANRPTDL